MRKTMPALFRKIINWLILMVGTALFLAALLIGVCMYFNSAPPVSPDAAEPANAYFAIRKGESERSVGRRLEQAGLIRNQYFWQLLCRLDREYVKSGHYRLQIPASQMAIRRTLVTGSQMLQRALIPEGSTLKKTAKLLEAAGVCPAEAFLAAAESPAMVSRYHIPGATMEGYLFPDTYLFPAEYPAEKVVETMADTFFEHLGAIDAAAPSLPPEELNRRVIIASIVEREYRVDEEAPLMAGVFYNRLGIGMALQSCATVEYVITEIQGRPHPETLSTRDTEIRNPYNTYVRPGLPPGPICSPGGVALRAAFYPRESGFFYFRLVNPAAGRHYFSSTLDDHIKAGVLYVKGK
jgi:UPF0755 protein